MEKLTKADKILLQNVLRGVRAVVPPNLCPTFYNTFTYEGDLKVKEHADLLAKKLGIDEPPTKKPD